MTANQQVVPSEWTPLHIAAFRAIWFASLAANVGTWFQNVGGVWLMTRFTSSPRPPRRCNGSGGRAG